MKKYAYIDYIRIIAVFLVLYGHLICVGTNNITFPEIISKNNEKYLPLIPPGTHHLYFIERILYTYFNTQTAVVGVFLFFILTGYLMAMSRYKYTTRNFLINRVLRLFPILLLTIIISGFLLFTVQGIKYDWHNYISTLLLIYPFVQIAPVLGVLWTLIVELIFYLIISHVKKMDFKFIVIFNLVVILLIVFNKSLNSINLFSLIYYLKYISIILIGVAVYYSEHLEKKSFKLGVILLSIVLSYLVLFLNKMFAGDETTYTNFGTYFVALFIYFSLYLLNQFKSSLFSYIPRLFVIIADIGYPVYLLQLPVGFTIMYLVKVKLALNSYCIVLLGGLSVLIIAYLVHRFIEEPMYKYGRKLFKI